MNTPAPTLTWTDDAGTSHTVRWCSPAGHPPPSRVVVADDSLGAAAALRLAADGTGLLWRGDFQNARHLLQAMDRRLQARAARPGAAAAALPAAADEPPAARPFFEQRRRQAERARLLGALLLPFDADHHVPLRRAPDVRAAAQAALGTVGEPYIASLRELLGLIGAWEWRRKGVPVAALGSTVHPHHGVFAPVRGEYVDLVARAPLPPAAHEAGAFDIGTGTGVLAAVLARRGLHVVATDCAPAAVACAADNLERLGLSAQVRIEQADLYPAGRAGLVVCNPPWLPVPPASALEAAVYDPGSRMLRGFLDGLAAHLAPGGEGWLIMSDLAEHLGLRGRDEFAAWIAAANLRVRGRLDARPTHRRASDTTDPLHAARAAELTSLWRLGPAAA